MKPERNSFDFPHARGPFLPPGTRAADAEDAMLAELRAIWPSHVDLAKTPGTLMRLSAILNA
jgi:hypothetical protein